MDDVLDRVLVVQLSRGVYRYTASLGTLLLYTKGQYVHCTIVLDHVLVVQLSRVRVYRYTVSLGTLVLYTNCTVCTLFKYVLITIIT